MRRRPRAYGVLLTLTTLLAACGSGSGSTPTTSTLPTTVSAPTSAPAPTSSPGAARSGSGTSSPALTGTSVDPDAGSFVTRSGRQLLLGGRPFRFVGVNIYDAAASDRYSCNPGKKLSDADLLSTLKYLHDEAGVTVLRFWAYQTYTQGATFYGGLDRVLAAAEQLGMKVIPVLEDGPGNCTNMTEVVPKSKYRSDSWYTEGYRVPYGNATLSYRDYVKAIVQHYANDPTILAWSMMNEADTSARTPSGQTVLVNFAKDIAGQIRAVDARHLITVGTQGNGAPGASGPDFTAVYGLPEIDLAEVHDWGYWGDDQSAMPGGQGATPPAADSPLCTSVSAPIGCSFALAATVDKPLFVGEAGMAGTTDQDRASRATLIKAKMDAAFGAGAVGYLVWSINTGMTDGYDILLTDGDPLLGQMAAVAASVG